MSSKSKAEWVDAVSIRVEAMSAVLEVSEFDQSPALRKDLAKVSVKTLMHLDDLLAQCWANLPEDVRKFTSEFRRELERHRAAIRVPAAVPLNESQLLQGAGGVPNPQDYMPLDGPPAVLPGISGEPFVPPEGLE